LSDPFLEEIAREYLRIGRGYARAIASERHVSERTVVSWVEKARRRGILTRVPPGSFGGTIVPKSRRRATAR
jgi:transposase